MRTFASESCDRSFLHTLYRDLQLSSRKMTENATEKREAERQALFHADISTWLTLRMTRMDLPLENCLCKTRGRMHFLRIAWRYLNAFWRDAKFASTQKTDHRRSIVANLLRECIGLETRARVQRVAELDGFKAGRVREAWVIAVERRAKERLQRLASHWRIQPRDIEAILHHEVSASNEQYQTASLSSSILVSIDSWK
ncbi:uncharacterized protein LOC128892831 [Hylaeus anthracinus]|uniref:uncharacterized protein LOC128892830 n=1 Tax=Hylaeus anthracinus TaxID=313031 RepID=UPI0023B8C0BB|nr:uncharacterized protein LOC128892830 [Hylaeus anthracinus]XP_054009370.1 uncharacterized protein LOC128892831 [Hylaeus anthracinus]